MDRYSLVYIDDNPETALTRYLDEEFKSDDYEIVFSEIIFKPEDGYESLLSDQRVSSANIILIDSWLFENRTAANVKFTGALTGDALVTQFKQGDLYIFTSFHEGMPTSVLEAMAFGLPVVTRPVGGLVDFFENGKMGEMVDSFEVEDFVPMVEKYLNDKELTKQTSVYNHEYAKKHFLASQVALRLEEIFSNIIKG